MTKYRNFLYGYGLAVIGVVNYSLFIHKPEKRTWTIQKNKDESISCTEPCDTVIFQKKVHFPKDEYNNRQ